jgi:amino acid transporter
MQALVLIGLVVYYAAVAVAFDSLLRKKSLWFTTFLAIVVSQIVLFGGDYLYRGYWESWNVIALVTSSAMCIVTSTAVAVFFHLRRSKAANAPT